MHGRAFPRNQVAICPNHLLHGHTSGSFHTSRPSNRNVSTVPDCCLGLFYTGSCYVFITRANCPIPRKPHSPQRISIEYWVLRKRQRHPPHDRETRNGKRENHDPPPTSVRGGRTQKAPSLSATHCLVVTERGLGVRSSSPLLGGGRGVGCGCRLRMVKGFPQNLKRRKRWGKRCGKDGKSLP